MYNVDPSILEKFRSNLQTDANNNDPRLLVYITRNKTAITSQRYWEKTLITNTVGTRSSIAVRRPEGSLLSDMIFTAQVEDGDAIIRYARPKTNINDMEWTVEATIPNVSDVSMAFDGYMKKIDDKVEAYTVGELPYVFYIDAGGLKYLNLDGDEQGTISAGAVSVDAVRGLYSETADMDDGIWVFYINGAGELWEVRLLGGEVEETAEITMMPDAVSYWTDVWAGTTWDYRIILQLKGDDGLVYTLISKSRPGGFSALEYLRVSKATFSGKITEIPPVALYVENILFESKWDRRLKVTFDKPVYNVTPELKDYFRIVETTYNTYIYPDNVSYGVNNNKIYLDFNSFHRALPPLEVEYLGGTDFGGEDDGMESFVLDLFLQNIKPSDGSEYLKVSNVTFEGEIQLGFDGKVYNNEYLKASSANFEGLLIKLSYHEAHAVKEYLKVNSATFYGEYCDINGVPV